MAYDLDWVQDVVSDPLPVKPVPGQTEMGLDAPRATDTCLCGGVLAYEFDDPDAAAVVARHNQSPRHREWQTLGGLSLTTDTEMVGHVPVEMFPTEL